MFSYKLAVEALDHPAERADGIAPGLVTELGEYAVDIGLAEVGHVA